MLLYNRYISNKILVGFGGIVTVLISLIWFSRAIGFMSYVTENGIELSKFFYLFALILPWILLLIIPISLFAAILLIYNKLISSNEITILKNSGLTKIALCKPALLPMCAASIICFLISFYLMPFANKELKTLRNNFDNNYASLSFNPGTFETLKNLTIYAHQRDENNRLFGILLHDEKTEKNSITITAKSGSIKSEGNSTLLYMEDGTLQRFTYEDSNTEILYFDNYVFNLTEGKKDEETLRWRAKERYMSELIFPKEEISKVEEDKFRAEINKRITNPLLPIILSMIALSCILYGKFSRGGNISNILFAVAQATTVMISTVLIYDLIESSKNYIFFTFLLYFVLISSLAISFKMLKR